jgi:cytochrome d ubiquinol oxidase subunit I
MEGQFETEAHAPLRIGGLPNTEVGVTEYAIEVPGGLSLLAHGDPAAVVVGLNDIPRPLWPPVSAVHLAFQVMVAIGGWLAVVATWAAVLCVRKRVFTSTTFLWATALSTPLGFVAVEAGWMVTELGRQPWIIHGVMRTADAVTPMPGLVFPFAIFTVIYLGLAAVVIVLIRHTILKAAVQGEAHGVQ